MLTELEEPFSVVQQVVDSLLNDAERLRLARARGWPTKESDEALQLAAEKVERFRVGLIRFARKCEKSPSAQKMEF